MLDEIRNEQFVTLAEELSSNQISRLSDLHIESCHLKQSACTALAQMLEQNEMLQRLEIVLYHNNNANTTEDATSELPIEIDWNATGLADALTRNTSLKYFRIFAENISKHNYSDAFVRMLQTNVHLEYLVLGWDGESSSDIEFYLLMNRHGRRHLTEQATKATWINFISQHANNLRVIHYVLTRNPSLVQEMNAV
jgi:hypothetical protein